jgi:hypothetical protein
MDEYGHILLLFLLLLLQGHMVALRLIDELLEGLPKEPSVLLVYDEQVMYTKQLIDILVHEGAEGIMAEEVEV